MNVCLLCVSQVVSQRSLRWADHSYRGVLQTVCVCLSVIVKPYEEALGEGKEGIVKGNSTEVA